MEPKTVSPLQTKTNQIVSIGRPGQPMDDIFYTEEIGHALPQSVPSIIFEKQFSRSVTLHVMNRSPKPIQT